SSARATDGVTGGGAAITPSRRFSERRRTFSLARNPPSFVQCGMQKLFLALLAVFTALLSCTFGAPTPNGRAEHIVVVVWDGMRPDFITPQYCPTLYGLATNGTFFRCHHP